MTLRSGRQPAGRPSFQQQSKTSPLGLPFLPFPLISPSPTAMECVAQQPMDSLAREVIDNLPFPKKTRLIGLIGMGESQKAGSYPLPPSTPCSSVS